MLSLKESNNYIIKHLNSNNPFFIARMGMGGETFCAHYFAINNVLNKDDQDLIDKIGSDLFTLRTNTGIYSDKHDFFIEYCKKYNEALSHANALGYQDTTWIEKEQKYYLERYKLTNLYARVLEPFYCCKQDIIPWTYYLLGKKVLVVHPFVDSMKLQIFNSFKIFKNRRIFLKGQEIKFYKAYNTAAGNNIHSSWLETFKIMCADIENIDFDIALLGCGGYGLPLSDYIHTNLKKSAIYIGGGLQLLFGIIGKRWEDNEESGNFWREIIEENDTKFIRPSEAEQIKNKEDIEGGCYW